MAGKGAVISVIITGAADGLKKATREASGHVDGFGGKMGGVAKLAGIAGLAIGAGALAALPGLFTLGNNLQAMEAKAKTVFGDQLPMMEKWAAGVSGSMGLSKAATVNMATSLADLLIPMGFTKEKAAELSQGTVDLAGALSAWSNGTKSATEVSDIMTKAMLGETDGLKALGISISAADIEARMAADGTDKLTGKMFEQAKAEAIMTLIKEKSTDAQKAWNDGTMDGVKAQNELKAKVEELKGKLATALAPIFDKIIGILNDDLIPAFEALTGWLEDNKVVAGILAGVIGALGTAIAIFSIKTWIATGALKATATWHVLAAVAAGIQAVATWILNAALIVMNANLFLVIGVLVLVGIGVYLAIKYWDKLTAAIGWAIDKLKAFASLNPFGGSNPIDDLVKKQKDLDGSSRAASDQMDIVTQAVADYGDKTKPVTLTVEEMKAATDKLNAQLKLKGELLRDEIDAYKELNPQLKRNYDLMVDLLGLDIAHNETARSLGETIGKNGPLLDTWTKKGIENTKALLADSDATLDMVELLGVKHGENANAFAIDSARYITDTKERWKQLGLGGPVVDGLTAKLDELTKDRELKIRLTVSGTNLANLNNLGLADPEAVAQAMQFNGPQLAHGGIVSATPGGTLVNVGEGGEDEAVIPLSKLGSGGGGNTYVTITGPVYGLDDLDRKLVESLARAKRSGTLVGVL
jgi:hypothetical protein